MKNTGISLYYNELPALYFRQGLCKISLIITLLAAAGCIQQNDEPEDAWDAGSGMVNIRIPLNPQERYTLPMDEPSKNIITYYEAVLREHNTETYYTGSAAAGESFLVVQVLPGKNYDALVLAGVKVNGLKVLTASGYLDNTPVVYGQRNVITVQMRIHKTTDRFTEEQGSFIYKPSAAGVKALLDAKHPAKPLTAAGQSYVIPYPDPSVQAPLNPSVTVTADPSTADGTLELTLADIPLTALTEFADYKCYYNLTYYAYSDPASRSSAWDIRRGITNELDWRMGGAVLLNHGITCYVRQDGNDSGAGTESDPFKSIARAVSEVRNTANPYALGKIIVLGVLNDASENASDSESVFVISNTPPGTGGVIRLTGRPYNGNPAKLDAAGSGKRVLRVSGKDTVVQLEDIQVTGANVHAGIAGAGIYAGDQSELVLLAGADVCNNKRTNDRGGGVAVINGTFIMYGGKISGNKAKYAAGVYLAGNSRFIMEDGSIENNESNAIGGGTGYGGGVWMIDTSSFEMRGGSITDNSIINSIYTWSGGGGVLMASTGSFIMSGTALIAGNSINAVAEGGGVRLSNGTFEVRGNFAKIENNWKGYPGNTNNVYKSGGTFIFRGTTYTANGQYNATP